MTVRTNGSLDIQSLGKSTRINGRYLVRGKIDLFSIDMLVTMLSHAGVQVSVVIEPAAA